MPQARKTLHAHGVKIVPLLFNVPSNSEPFRFTWSSIRRYALTRQDIAPEPAYLSSTMFRAPDCCPEQSSNDEHGDQLRLIPTFDNRRHHLSRLAPKPLELVRFLGKIHTHDDFLRMSVRKVGQPSCRSPPISRNVGKPLSWLMPAPVKTTILFGFISVFMFGFPGL